MRDTTNILLGCDLRQGEVAQLVRILEGDPLLVKLVKGAIENELEDATDPESMFWVATPNVFVLLEFFAVVGKSFYTKTLSNLVAELAREPSSEPGFPSTFAHLFLSNISCSFMFAPSELVEVCSFLYERASKKFPGITRAQAVGPFIILRGFASILMRPQAFGLILSDQLTPDTKCTLIKIAKSLICLSSLNEAPLTKDIPEDVGEDMKLHHFANQKNHSQLSSFLEELVDKTSPSNGAAQIDAAEHEVRVKRLIALLNKLLTRVNSEGINPNKRAYSLISELLATVERTNRLDVDIHESKNSMVFSRPATVTRVISKVVLQPRKSEPSEPILDLGKGKLLDEVAFKLYYKDTVCFCHLLKKKVSLKKIQSIVQKNFYTNDLTIRYKDEDGDFVPITTNEEFKQCVEKSSGLTVKFYLTSELMILPQGVADDTHGLQKALAGVERRLRAQYPNQEFARESFVISDFRQPDNPLVYVNDGFEKLTLYPSEDILGKNCRFLQGKQSDLNVVYQISKAIKNGVDINVELVNYRKDGTPFWNRFHIFPLRANNGDITHFVAVQQDITHLKQRARNPREWAPSDVADWLGFMRLEQLAPRFETNDIDGKQLLQLTEARLQEIGVENVKDRERILQYITYLIGTSVPTPAPSVSVKAYSEGDVRVFKTKPTVSLKAFHAKIVKILGLQHLPTVVQFERNNEKLTFASTVELQQLLQEAKLRGESFKVWAQLC